MPECDRNRIYVKFEKDVNTVKVIMLKKRQQKCLMNMTFNVQVANHQTDFVFNH